MKLDLSEEELDRIRQRRGELFAQWRALRAGDTLALSFDLSAAPFA
jgi:hypothetical protein